MGTENFDRQKLEGPSKKHRRSIFVSKDVKKNDIITEKNIAVVRPSNGLHPKYYFKILGKKINKDISAGTPLKKIFIKD